MPSGCLAEGQSIFDIGECPQIPCRSDTTDNGSCSEIDAHCCGPLSYARVDIPCEYNITLPILMPTSCGCASCPDKSITLSGVASGTDGTGLLYGDIILNGTVLTQTDDSGKFTLDVEAGTQRMVLLFRDTILEYLMDTVYAIDIPKDTDGVLYLNVKMLPTTKTVELQSDVGNTVPLSSNESTPIIAQWRALYGRVTCSDHTLF